MNFSGHLMPKFWLWSSDILYIAILVWSIWKTPWHHLKNPDDTHVLLGSGVALWTIWHMSGGVTAGLEFHLLLVTTITLMFTWPWAILLTSVVQLGLTLEGRADWMSYPLNMLCNGVIPILITYSIYRLTYLWLPRHFFIYIYMVAFAGGAISMLGSRLMGMWVLLASHVYTWSELGDEPMFMMMMLFPEAFTNGFLMTLLVVYRPQWVSSFSDKHYLQNK